MGVIMAIFSHLLGKRGARGGGQLKCFCDPRVKKTWFILHVCNYRATEACITENKGRRYVRKENRSSQALFRRAR